MANSSKSTEQGTRRRKPAGLIITIHKYTIENKAYQLIELPSGYEILSVQNQNEEITFWVLGNSNGNLVTVPIEIFGTGYYMEEAFNYRRKFLGTVQLGSQVWHVFTR